MPRKEFVAFTRLDASDVNSFLMDQSVMTFADSAARDSAIATPTEGMFTYLQDTKTLEFYDSVDWVAVIPDGGDTGQLLAKASSSDFDTIWKDSDGVRVFADSTARGSAITSPVEGMTTYLNDIDAIETYNGSAWVSPFGLTFIKSTDFTSVSSVSVNDVFSSAYDNYKLVMNFQGSSNALISMRLRVAGSDNSSNIYTQQGVQTSAGTIQNPPGVGTTTSFSLINVSSGIDVSGASMDLLLPFLARRTRHSLTGFYYVNATNSSVLRGGEHDSATSFTGFTLITSAGNITGNITVYGYRKS